MGEKKKFSLMSAILSVICVVFVAEAGCTGSSNRKFTIFLVDLFIDCIPFALWIDLVRVRNNLYR